MQAGEYEVIMGRGAGSNDHRCITLVKYMFIFLKYKQNKNDKAVAKKAQKKRLLGSNRIRTHDLCDTGAMLYQLSYEVLLVVGQE